MSTLLFVIVWVIIAIALVVYAMTGGRRRGRERRSDAADSRSTRFATVGFIILALALGAVLPYAIIKSVEDRDDIPEVGIESLTAAQQHGRELFAERCKLCHTLKASNASAKVGPNLDELKRPKAVVLDAIENGRARGNGQMPADLAEGEEADDLAEYVAAVAGRTSGE
jgi:mono/diheme cytochrome c family protein